MHVEDREHQYECTYLPTYLPCLANLVAWSSSLHPSTASDHHPLPGTYLPTYLAWPIWRLGHHLSINQPRLIIIIIIIHSRVWRRESGRRRRRRGGGATATSTATIVLVVLGTSFSVKVCMFCMYVCMCVYMYVCTCMYVCLYVCMCVCMYVCRYVCVCTFIHGWMDGHRVTRGTIRYVG